jgi:pimeloyl-ACP methyl ester carboxylesterase
MRTLLLAALFSMAAATAPPPIEHATAEVNGVTLHYAKSGTGQLMLFLHGFPEFWYAWKDQLDEFGKDHLAVAPDMRGYNLSSKPESVDQYRVPLLIEDVRALAERLGFGPERKFILVGHDWGGAVAWAYAAAHPETLDKLVIVNAPHPTIFGRLLREDPAQQKASFYMLMFRGPEAEKALSANNHQMLVDIVLGAGLKNGTFTEDDKKAYLDAWSQPGALTGGLNYYRAAQLGPPASARGGTGAAGAGGTGGTGAAGAGVTGATGATGAAGAQGAAGAGLVIKVPTLVIWGEGDTALLTSNLVGLDQYVPQLTVRRIPDGTHWVVHEKPAEVNRYIREFIAR